MTILRIDRVKFVAIVNNKPVNLTPKEFDILDLLERERGRVVGRALLLEKVYGYSRDVARELKTRTVDSHVAHLRAKLGRAGQLLKTVPYRGYCLEAR